MTKIFNPLGRTMQRRDFLKVAGASVAVAALPAAVRGADPVKVLLWSWVPDLPASGRHVQRRASGHPGRTRECRPGRPGVSGGPCGPAGGQRPARRRPNRIPAPRELPPGRRLRRHRPVGQRRTRASSPKARGRRSPRAMWSTPCRRIPVRWRCSIARTSSTSMGSRRPPPGPSLPMRPRRSMRPIRMCSSPTRCSAQATGSMVCCGRWAGSRSAAMATSSRSTSTTRFLRTSPPIGRTLLPRVSSRPSRGSTMSGTPASTRAAMPPGSLRAGVRCS